MSIYLESLRILGINQAELSRRLGVSRSAITQKIQKCDKLLTLSDLKELGVLFKLQNKNKEFEKLVRSQIKILEKKYLDIL